METDPANLPHGRLVALSAKDVAPSLQSELGRLASTLLEKLQAEAEAPSSNIAQVELQLLHRLQREVELRLDVPQWRLSPAIAAQQFSQVRFAVRHRSLPIRDAVHVDIGCGSSFPYGRMFVHLMAGARRAYCFDLDPIQDEGAAVRAMAALAAAALVDPPRIFGDLPITRDEILRNLEGFDLARLSAGDPAGIARERLQLVHRSIDDLGLPGDSVDAVFSNSVLEHLPDVGAVLAETARILRPGGFAAHGIDTKDHRWYGNPKQHPLEFLTEPAGPKILYGCNRLRIQDYPPLFRAAGFDIVDDAWVGGPVEITPELRRRLQPPWSGRSDEELTKTWLAFLLRRVVKVG